MSNLRISEIIDLYKEYAKKAGDSSRTYALGGLGIIWAIVLSPEAFAFTGDMLWPAFFFVLSLACDFIQHVYQTMLFLFLKMRYQNRDRQADTEVSNRGWYNRPSHTLFFVKIFSTFIGIVLLLYQIWRTLQNG